MALNVRACPACNTIMLQVPPDETCEAMFQCPNYKECGYGNVKLNADQVYAEEHETAMDYVPRIVDEYERKEGVL
jgi:ssDNA-binding Zn-finger/Zn-ribbon topoisomerase 1